MSQISVFWKIRSSTDSSVPAGDFGPAKLLAVDLTAPGDITHAFGPIEQREKY